MTQIAQTVEKARLKTEELDEIPPILLHHARQATLDFFRQTCGDASTTHFTITDCRPWTKIVGIISFVGDLTWSIVLVLPEHTAEILAHKFAGFKIDFNSEDMGDVIGEMANIIAGTLSGNLEKDQIKSYISLPTVARGNDFEHIVPEHFIAERQYFQSHGNDFWLKIFMAKPPKN